MKTKILALILALTMVLCALPAQAYTVRDGYLDFVAQYPEFVEKVLSKGQGRVSESMVIDFLAAIQRNLYDQNRYVAPVTEENFDDALINAVMSLSMLEAYAPLQAALLRAYPDAVSDALLHGRISPELMPLYEAVKAMVFDHNMLNEIDKSDNPTVYLMAFDPLDDVTVAKGSTPKLPAYTQATSETGIKVQVSINWTTVPGTGSTGTYTAVGRVTIPNGYEVASGVSDEIKVNVIVESNGTSGSTNGTSGSTSGGVTGNADTDNTDNKIVHKHTFTDVNESTASGKAIYALADAGVINGYPDETFKPDGNITRAEIMTMVVNALGILNAEATASFNDVAKADWYYVYIASGAANNLIKGYEDGSFKPNSNITRAEVMTIIYRVLNERSLLTAKAGEAVFADDASIPDWSKNMVYALRDNGIVTALSDNKIQAEQLATREQCAVILYNALVKMGKIK